MLKSALVVVIACLGFAACAGGPHPEPPNQDLVSGTGGHHANADAGLEGGGSGSGGGVPVTGGSGGMSGSAAGSGGMGGGAGSGAEDGGAPNCPDRDTDDMDGGTACLPGDDDAGALR